MRTLAQRLHMLASGVRYWRPLSRCTARPTETQAAVLARILSDNRETEFGVAHGFGSIRTPDEFRRRVPVQHYESLRPHVERQRVTGRAALTREPPLFYAQTSGSTGAPKHIPITATSLTHHRAEQALFTYLQYRACPAAFSGSAWGIMGAAVEGHLDSGHAVGSVSGYLYESLPRALQSRFVVPPMVSSIHDAHAKYLVILRLALATPDVTYLGSPNPSTFVRLLDLLNTHRDVLARSLETGSFDALINLDTSTDIDTAGARNAQLRSVLSARCVRAPERARRLKANAPLTYADLWPHLALLTTWTGGSCGIALDALRRTLPRGCAVMELGYQATEMRGTLALEPETPAGLPPIHHHFFEFVAQDLWERDEPEFVGLADLEAGRRYYVVVTTAAGLYRYFMNDIVEVTGRLANTPLLRFVQKGRGVTSLTGEKLYESQALQAVTESLRAAGRDPAFLLVIADETAARYHAYVEIARDASAPDSGTLGALSDAIDRRLGELNIEYRSKRTSGRLGPLVVSLLRPGAADAYQAHAVASGQREGQFKPRVLQYRHELAWPADTYVAA